MFLLDTRLIRVLLVIAAFTFWKCGATSYPFFETNSLSDVLRHLLMNDSPKSAFEPSPNRITRNWLDSNADHPIVRKAASTTAEGLQTIHVHNNFFLISNPHELNINIAGPSPLGLVHPTQTNAPVIGPELRDKSTGSSNGQLATVQTPNYYHEVPTIPSASSNADRIPLGHIGGVMPKTAPRGSRIKAEKHCDTLGDGSLVSNIFIDGKNFGDPACSKSQNTTYDESSVAIQPENVQPLAINPSPVLANKHILHCIPETDPHCNPDSIVFDGGLKVQYQDIRNMFELISQQPESIKLIVPGGISGPLANYFQRVDRSRHEEAAKYGVCVFPNGLLVPIKPMLRILQLHFWLLQSSNDANAKDGNALHRSINWSNMECVLELLRCLIEANVVFVRMPSNEVLPYSQFESNRHHISHEILKHCNVEILGVSISYLRFTNALLQLRQVVASSKPVFLQS